MAGHRPQPMTAGDEYLALILDQVERQGEVLAEIRDRLPEPAAKSGGREPVTEPARVELREPDPPKPAAKKTTPAKTTTAKKTTRQR